MDLKLIVFFFVLVVSTFAADDSTIVPENLKTEYLHYPLTVENPHPRFSWKLRALNESAQNLTQTAYQILVSSIGNNGTLDLWDSGVVKSDTTVHIRYAGKPLKSRQLAVWKVKVWDQNGAMAESAEQAKFGMGLLHASDWKAKWIHAQPDIQKSVAHALQHDDQTVITKLPGLLPPLYFRKSFQLEQIPQGARLFTSAHGIYEIYLNGKRLDASHFNPGYTDFHKSIRYQSFVNLNLVKGENVIGVVVGGGWYGGYIGYDHRFGHGGNDLGPLVQLDDVDGVTFLSTDASWKVSTGPIAYSDMLMGETYYVEKQINGWNQIKYNDSDWKHVEVQDLNPQVALVGDVSEPVITSMTLTPKSVHEPSPGVFVFDFGQNFAGVCSLSIHAGQGPARIQLRHAEVVNKNGSLYTENLRSARAIDTLVIKDKVEESFTYTPSFTFHGFRFVELTGYAGTPKLSDLVANVFHSGVHINSPIQTSNQLVNRLLLNIQWGLRSNFMSVPTDCPQRNERLGWTGDAQVFASTAVYNADLLAFYSKWLRDLREAQMPSGGLPNTVPNFDKRYGSPGWQNAMVIVPWVVYSTYGDVQTIKDNYEAMTRHMNYIKSANHDYLWRNRTQHIYGDWLEMNAATDHYVLSTAFFAQDALLMAKMAQVLGKAEDVKMYTDLFYHISAAFNAHYVVENGTIQGDTQAAYVFALTFSLLPEKLRPLAVQKLIDNIKQHNNHLTTGFLSVGLLNPALTEFGHNDVAYKLLLQDTYPSWLYPVAHGNATTIWERWDGWTEAKGFENPSMNSFNHYSMGSVGRWLYAHVAGIESDGAGYKRIIIKPNPGQGLTWVNATYESIHGTIGSSWTVMNDKIEYTVSVPVNTKATVILPGHSVIKHEVGSGTWKFETNKHFE